MVRAEGLFPDRKRALQEMIGGSGIVIGMVISFHNVNVLISIGLSFFKNQNEVLSLK